MIFLNIFTSFCIFIIGTLFGSFFSLAFYRIPKREDIVIKNSYCPKCKHDLGFFDLIPIISFIKNKGECKYCKQSISFIYPLLEIFNGIVFLILYLLFGYTVNLLIFASVYVAIFFILGTLFSNYKLKNVETKKGVFLTELIVGIILFSIILTSMYVIIRNNVNKSSILIAKSNAMSLAIENIEIAKLTEYDKLISFSKDERVDNIDYHIEVKISKLSDEDTQKLDIVKKIETIVKYSVNNKNYDFSLNAVKGKV